ncbi:uncharacterized protein DUF1049 [Hoeflea marina]|uniref:Uncharacterized protein DUF1049 n=1 Tax=Hoeflea marina TaxID=274592 RepID=A0A317PNL0_9HYPH|nr:LapA family protein [Hoeflea marina]PWW00081.1 uncharacterized protein DUF1049 [Hoeflea marina]
MFKRIITLVILVPVAIVLILLSVANRQTVTLAFNPFEPSDPVLSQSAPLFVFLFAALMLGMIIGSLATWFNQGKHRSRARNKAQEAVKWHSEADRQKAKATELARSSTLPPPAESAPRG